MADRGISLRREEAVKTFVANRGDVFRLRITATDPVLMPKHIFLHQKTLVDPNEATQADEFIAIASPFDCTIYPANSPDASQFPAFFRKDSIDILLASTEMVKEAWEAIQAQVCNLVAAYNRLDVLSETSTVRCGASAETSLSESESSST